MRYFWVEDFDGDSTDKGTKENTWKNYFGLGDRYILMGTLEDALEYLDDYGNHSNFDAVLLDIRFPVEKKKDSRTENGVYEKWFSKYITRSKFDEYTRSGGANASSGILLFLALVYHYGYSWNDIAFLSANVGSGDANTVLKLKEFLAKRFYGKTLNSDERGKYTRWHGDLARTYLESILSTFPREYKLSWNRIALNNLAKEIDTPGVTQEQRRAVVAGCFEVLDALRKRLNENDGESEEARNDLKYWSVSKDFRRLGLEIPSPFEKPGNYKEGDECCSFRYWKDERTNPCSVAKRSIIDICRLARGILEDESKADGYKDFLEQQQNYKAATTVAQGGDYESEASAEVDHNDITRDTLIQYFDNILRKAAKLPLVLSDENRTYYATEIVEVIAPLWADVKYKSGDWNFNVCRNVLHLARNWMAHQRINHIDIQFAVFLFLLAVRGIFAQKFLESDEYLKEEAVLLEKVFEASSVGYEKIDDKEGRLENLYNNLFKRVTDAAKESPSMYVEPDMPPYSLVSLLGHEDNPYKKLVESADLHKLFWLMIHFRKTPSTHRWQTQQRGRGAGDVWIPLMEKTCGIVFSE